VGQLRALRKQPRKGILVSVSAADLLNLFGITTRATARPDRFFAIRTAILLSHPVF
jgi:hypothetical protein